MTMNGQGSNKGGGTTGGGGVQAEHFNIRWKNYSGVLQNVFRSLLEEERLVDCTLACDGGFIKCHRIILSACSSYFESLLGELGNEPNLVIFLKDIKMWELRALVKFMYNGEVSVKQNSLEPLIRAAKSLHIRGLSNEKDDVGRFGGGQTQEKASKTAERKQEPPIHHQKQQGNGQGVKRPSTSNTIGRQQQQVPQKVMRPMGKPQSIVKPMASRVGTIKADGVNNGQRRSSLSMESDETKKLEMARIAEIKQEEGDGSVNDANTTEESMDSSDMVMADEAYNEEGNEAYLDDGTANNVSPSNNGITGQFQILDPPMTQPVSDATDRLNRLKKATALALAGCTVRQAAAHYAIPRTTLCAYMKRQGIVGRRLSNAASVPGGSNRRDYYPAYQDQEGEGEEESSSDFPFLGLGELVAGAEAYATDQGENEIDEAE